MAFLLELGSHFWVFLFLVLLVTQVVLPVVVGQVGRVIITWAEDQEDSC